MVSCFQVTLFHDRYINDTPLRNQWKFCAKTSQSLVGPWSTESLLAINCQNPDSAHHIVRPVSYRILLSHIENSNGRELDYLDKLKDKTTKLFTDAMVLQTFQALSSAAWIPER